MNSTGAYDKHPETTTKHGRRDKLYDTKLIKLLFLGNGNESGRKLFAETLSSMVFSEFEMEDEISVSLIDFKNAQIAVYSIPNMTAFTAESFENYISEINGIIGYFDAESRDSFKLLQDLITYSITKIGKVLPLMLVGQITTHEISSVIPVADVLKYSYDLAETTCHQIPYRVISSVDPQEIQNIVNDMVKIMVCDKQDLCRDKSPLNRKWCEVDQFFSFINDSNVQLL